MANIHDYLLWRGDLTLEKDGFNEIDALILAALSYLPFEKLSLKPMSAPISIREATLYLLALPDIEESVHLKDDIEFMRALLESDRFSGLLLTHYVNRIDEETQTQFAAITVQINETLSCVLFRGTDSTLVGWKENFNMSFTFPVPAQKSAVEYLETIATSLNGNLIVGGHSKGGNLAMCAATFCNPEIQDRIVSIYNLDGPGFDEKVLSTEQYQRVRDKMSTYVPQFSIVGMLLEHEEQYIIVRSAEKVGYLQHNIYSWEAERNHLVYLDSVSNGSRFIDYTLKGWIADMDINKRQKFVDALYEIISQTNVRTLKEMDAKWFESTIAIFSSIGNLDEETRNLITETLSLLEKSAKKTFGQVIETWGKDKSIQKA